MLSLRSSLPRFLLSGLVCVASALPSVAQRYAFKTYAQAQGLKNLNVDSMLQDRDGYMWMGTDNGLFRYDGDQFQQFGASEGLKNPYVLALVQDSSGRLWAGTGGGLFYREGSRFEEVLYKGKPIGVGADSSMAGAQRWAEFSLSASYRLFVVSRGTDGNPHAQQAVELNEFRGLAPEESITSVGPAGDQETWLGCGYAPLPVSQRTTSSLGRRRRCASCALVCAFHKQRWKPVGTEQ